MRRLPSLFEGENAVLCEDVKELRTHLLGGQCERRQICGCRAAAKHRFGPRLRLLCLRLSMHKLRDLIGEHRLGLVDRRIPERT